MYILKLHQLPVCHAIWNMFIKEVYLRALIRGKGKDRKTKEGRMGRDGDMVSNVAVGKRVCFQTWTLIVWWLVKTVDKYPCQ